MFGTLSLLAVTMALALVPGIGCGIYLACYAPPRKKQALETAVDVLAGIPSIVMGLFGFVLILFLRRTLLPRGTTCLLLASVCLAILVLPTLVTATQSALEALPERLYIDAAALGLSRGQALRHLLVPAASPGLLGGVILAMGRTVEDTAVIMLTGAGPLPLQECLVLVTGLEQGLGLDDVVGQEPGGGVPAVDRKSVV